MTDPPESPRWDPWGAPDAPDPAVTGMPGVAPSACEAGEPRAVGGLGAGHPHEAWSRAGAAPGPAAPAPPVPRAGRRGPGWGALVSTSLLVALVAGVGGGFVGGRLATTGGLSATTARIVDSPPTPGPGASTRPEGSVASVAAKAMPSVVTIRVESGSRSGSGSGWVLDRRGHIVTNNHVVAPAAGGSGGTVTVVLANGKHLDARVVGRDSSYDLAVLRVARTDLTPLPVGSSAAVVVGDPVVAVGSPLGLDSSVTTGIVSALNRPVSAGESDDRSFINAIQTDAAINPGNSGGPLLNMSGEVIGVNSAIATVPSLGGQAGSIGVGFAIPSNQVVKTVDQLITTGKARHPIIGVYLDETYDGEGVRVGADQPGRPAVSPGGPAARAGLRAGDVIVAFDGRPVTTPDELVVAIRAQDVGDKVTLTVRRGRSDEDVTMVLGEAGK